MYAGAIASSVHTMSRRAIGIAAVHSESNLRKPAYEEGENRGPLQREFAARKTLDHERRYQRIPEEREFFGFSIHAENSPCSEP